MNNNKILKIVTFVKEKIFFQLEHIVEYAQPNILIYKKYNYQIILFAKLVMDDHIKNYICKS